MAYNRIKHVKQVADEICETMGYDSYSEFDDGDIEYVSEGCQCCYADVCDILEIALPESLGPVSA